MEPSIHSERLIITDFSGSDGYFVNSPAGEYGVLFATASTDTDAVLSANQKICSWASYFIKQALRC
jgi:hypothetical protein